MSMAKYLKLDPSSEKNSKNYAPMPIPPNNLFFKKSQILRASGHKPLNLKKALRLTLKPNYHVLLRSSLILSLQTLIFGKILQI